MASTLQSVRTGQNLYCVEWGYFKRRVSTSVKVTLQDFDERKEQFLYDANVLVKIMRKFLTPLW